MEDVFVYWLHDLKEFRLSSLSVFGHIPEIICNRFDSVFLKRKKLSIKYFYEKFYTELEYTYLIVLLRILVHLLTFEVFHFVWNQKEYFEEIESYASSIRYNWKLYLTNYIVSNAVSNDFVLEIWKEWENE